jgi:Tol biopolymer transport system component
MKCFKGKKFRILCSTACFLLIVFGCAPKGEFSRLSGPYLGQTPPGVRAEIFAPGAITTEYHEHSSPEFSPDGTEVYWSVFFNFWGPQVILFMKQENGYWTQPEVAPFSGQYTDGNPVFSPDGKRLYFESWRPPEPGKPAKDLDLWFVEQEGDSWGQPQHLGWKINSDTWERGPCLSAGGNLYFTSMKEGGFGRSDIYCSKWETDGFSEPVNLGPAINTEGYESWPFIAPDESYLIYESDSGDLFINFRMEDGSWSKACDLSEKIQSERSQDRFPKLSRDKKYLFFVSNRWEGSRYPDRRLSKKELENRARSIDNGMGNVYWIKASIIEELKGEIK